MEAGMAQKVSITLVDDTDGGEAGETIQFGLDGTRYEIDLSTQNAGKLRAALAPYIKNARKAAGSAGRPRRPRRAAASGVNKEVREWAREQGFEVSERGRIPAQVTAAYEAAISK